MATLTERAFQIWPLLIHAARHRQLLTYDDLAYCTGMFTGGLGECLEPIQSYCLKEGYPPITMIVVSKKTGLPGLGFTAISIHTPADFAEKLQSIFGFDWSRKAPSVDELIRAVAERPSNGV